MLARRDSKPSSGLASANQNPSITTTRDRSAARADASCARATSGWRSVHRKCRQTMASRLASSSGGATASPVRKRAVRPRCFRLRASLGKHRRRKVETEGAVALAGLRSGLRNPCLSLCRAHQPAAPADSLSIARTHALVFGALQAGHVAWVRIDRRARRYSRRW